jgi:hypothetical protein
MSEVSRTTYYTISTTSLEDIMTEIVDALSPTLPCHWEDGLREELQIRASEDPAWGVGASLLILSRPLEAYPNLHRITVEVNAGGTRRTPAEAVAFARLYTRFADAACLAEAIHADKVYRPQEDES